MSCIARALWLSGLKRHAYEASFHVKALIKAGKLHGPGGSVTFRRVFSDATTQGDAEDAASVERYRESKNFRRRVDGRVLLHGKTSNTWMETKLDGYVEGSLLLLGQDGLVYYLVSEDLKQIDLSNDQLVGTLFGEGGWEQLMQPLYTQVTDGELKHVRMTPQQFRSIFTVLKESPPAPAQSA